MHSHLDRIAVQLVDSALASTREFWRARYFAATPEDAADPRPFADVLADREAE